MSLGHVLIVEDDPKMADIVTQILQKEGYQARVATSIFMAQGKIREFLPDLFIVDRRLPDGDGFDFCKELKSNPKTKTTPLLFLTSKNSTTDKVVGLKIGGDDYLTKPFHIEELLARVEALLRRVKGKMASAAVALRGHGISLDLDKHQCTIGQKRIDLWPKEFAVLQIFMERPGRLLNKEFLSQHVWGHELFTNSRTIEITVQRLRRKLGPKGTLIETVKGYGFRFQDE